MEAKKQAVGEEDLSMEEILQSIRRIISDDGGTEGKTDSKLDKAGEADVSPVATSEILELTDMIEDDGSVTNLKVSTKDPNAVDVLDNIDAALAKPVEAAPAPPPPTPVEIKQEVDVPTPKPAEPEKPVQVPADDSDSLLSKATEKAALSSFAKLEMPDDKSVHRPAPPPVFRSGSTIEDLVEDLLKPMMKDWLDNNLPSIVERIVEREVTRLTRR